MDVYAENILEHFRNPIAKQELAEWTVEHEEANVSCGDVVKVQLLLKEDVIEGIGWSGTGCAISQAAMSMLAEELVSKSADELLIQTKDDIYKMLGVPIGPRRFKCALIGLHTIKNAILKSRGEKPHSWLDTVEVEDG